MGNCEGGSPKEKRGSNNKEFGELNKEAIERLRNFLGTLDKQSGMCYLAQIGNSSISCSLRALDLSFIDS